MLKSGNQKANNVLSCMLHQEKLSQGPYLNHNGQEKVVLQLIQSGPGVHLVPEGGVCIVHPESVSLLGNTLPSAKCSGVLVIDTKQYW